MNRYILLSFLFMGWTFYVLSGGADFAPPSAAQIADAKDVPAEPQAQHEPVIAEVTPPEPVLNLEPVSLPAATAKLDSVTKPEPKISSAALIEEAIPAEPDLAEPETTGIVMQTGWASDFQDQPVRSDTVFSLASLAQVPEAAAQPPVWGNRTVKGSAVNVRSGPGTDHSVVSRLTGGTEVQVINDPGEGWVNIRHVESDTVGWMAASLLSP